MRAGEIIHGRYKLIRPIGEGGWGTVWEAQIIGGRRVAIKRVYAATAEDLQAFLNEANHLINFEHEHIVYCHGYERDKDDPRKCDLITEVIHGCTLDALIQHPEVYFSIECSAFVTYSLCEALNAIHSFFINGERSGLIHGDVAPPNIIISGTGHVKLVDFGIALLKRPGDAPLTLSNIVKGRPSYLAPEYFEPDPETKQRRIDHLVDIYAAGLIWHEMLIREPVFCAVSAMEIIEQVKAGARKFPHDRNPRIPLDVSRFIARMHWYGAGTRPHSAKSVMQEIMQRVPGLMRGKAELERHVQRVIAERATLSMPNLIEDTVNKVRSRPAHKTVSAPEPKKTPLLADVEPAPATAAPAPPTAAPAVNDGHDPTFESEMAWLHGARDEGRIAEPSAPEMPQAAAPTVRHLSPERINPGKLVPPPSAPAPPPPNASIVSGTAVAVPPSAPPRIDSRKVVVDGAETGGSTTKEIRLPRTSHQSPAPMATDDGGGGVVSHEMHALTTRFFSTPSPSTAQPPSEEDASIDSPPIAGDRKQWRTRSLAVATVVVLAFAVVGLTATLRRHASSASAAPASASMPQSNPTKPTPPVVATAEAPTQPPTARALPAEQEPARVNPVAQTVVEATTPPHPRKKAHTEPSPRNDVAGALSGARLIIENRQSAPLDIHLDNGDYNARGILPNHSVEIETTMGRHEVRIVNTETGETLSHRVVHLNAGEARTLKP